MKMAKHKLNLIGAKFQFVKADKVDDAIFNKCAGRKSAYAEALEFLVENTDQRMEVDSLTARGAIAAQAHKRGIRIVFGESAGKLYVKVIGKDTPESLALNALEKGPLNMIEMENVIHAVYRGQSVQDVISKLSASGQISLQNVTGTQNKKWHLLRSKALYGTNQFPIAVARGV